jgi:Cd2+/Zn2+-exporting ATPase
MEKEVRQDNLQTQEPLQPVPGHPVDCQCERCRRYREYSAVFKGATEPEEPEAEESDKFELISLVIGAVLFIGAVVYKNVYNLPVYADATLYALLAALVFLGWNVFLDAVKNLFKAKVLDENFLMSIASIGAFATGQYTEAVGVMLFFRLGEYFEEMAVAHSRSAIKRVVDMRPEVVNLVVDGIVKVTPAADIKVGDILQVRPGDRIPLDGVVVSGESRLDTSAVTGESLPVKVAVGSQVMSGCINTSGALTMKVEKVLGESLVSRILASMENAAAAKPKMDRFITRFSKIYTPVVVGLALIAAFVVPFVTGQDSHYWVYTALSFLVMSCPCALVLSVPLAFFCGIGTGSKSGILFRDGQALEVLALVKAAVMDKTGTLTKGEFAVQKIVPAQGFMEEDILHLAAVCELASTHPIGTSIVATAKKQKLVLNQPQDIEEISGHGIKATIDGSEVLCGNRKLMDKFNVSVPELSSSLGAEVFVAKDGRFAGQIVVADALKADAQEAIADLKAQDIKTVMLTGDSEQAAEAMAKEAGIDEVHAKLLPQDKVTDMQKIRQKYGRILFVGDGINDAPVLAGADVGAAMGSGADAAIEAAEVVFLNSEVSAVSRAIAIAKNTMSIAHQNVVLAIFIKVIVMILGITGIYANMWLAVFADTGVMIICVLNSFRLLYMRK